MSDYLEKEATDRTANAMHNYDRMKELEAENARLKELLALERRLMVEDRNRLRQSMALLEAENRRLRYDGNFDDGAAEILEKRHAASPTPPVAGSGAEG